MALATSPSTCRYAVCSPSRRGLRDGARDDGVSRTASRMRARLRCRDPPRTRTERLVLVFSCSSSPRWRRAVTLLAGCGAAVALSLAGQPAHADPVTNDPAEAAAGWLASQLVDGERFEFDSGVPDGGLTIDAVLAFAATKVAGDHAEAALDWLATPAALSSYLGHDFGLRIAGSYAKLAFGAQVFGHDPTSFGGVDLLAELDELRDDDGRYRNDPVDGDFSNAISQSLAILATERADGAPKDAVDFLVEAQCSDGGFPTFFDADTCTSDVDTTALVIQTLFAVDRDQDAAAGLGWLVDQQQPNGGFRATPPTDVINANSTGLAAQALRVAGEDAAADQAVAYLRSLQVGCDGPEEDRGMVVHTEAAPGDVPRATAQAILGLAGVGFDELDGTGLVADVPVLDCATPEPTVPDRKSVV